MRMFNTQKEVLETLARESTLIFNNEIIYQIHEGELKFRNLDDQEWQEPGLLDLNPNLWTYYREEKKEDYIKFRCLNQWCWVSNVDKFDRSTVTLIITVNLMKDQSFIDINLRTWEYATIYKDGDFE